MAAPLTPIKTYWSAVASRKCRRMMQMEMFELQKVAVDGVETNLFSSRNASNSEEN